MLTQEFSTYINMKRLMHVLNIRNDDTTIKE